ncbi:c-type cytochrome [Govanella unica]|uniref:Cytochrome c n=1 Tax=Govanella unica TaxID=2975056 RepID=A0A9X3TYL2_9PROT|nr:c-type cytochrome [Govania unica]MDA5194173.1 cytochrome c [Govania unica]
MKRILVILVVALVVGVICFALLARRPAIARIEPPVAASFSSELVAHGAVLAGAGYCATCHTAKGGQPYAGGYAMKTGFGTIYSTNITPDPDTGIGRWSEAAFRRAMHEGVARDGSHLFPAFPYDHFTKLSDGDVAALYAYFMTRPPVRAEAKKNALPFPLNIRALQAGWKFLFFKPGRFVDVAGKDADWNRGAYLAEGISHCGACHTPRNLLGAEKKSAAYAGAVIDTWVAPPLTKANPSPAPWTEDELFRYLRSGLSQYHGTSAGPMAPVVHDGLSKLTDGDIKTLALYFADIGGAASRAGALQPALQKALAADQSKAEASLDPAHNLYMTACASCHYNGAGGPVPLRPDLALNSALYLNDPSNLIHVMLFGINAKDGMPGVVMPGFANLSDARIAEIAAYLRATRTDKAAWPDLEKKVAAIRAQMAGQE